MALRVGTRLGPYEVLRLLGAGGMGEVYLARDHRLTRDVAVKVLPTGATPGEDAVARFEREAQAIAALNHPNICSVHDVGEHEGSPFLVMECLEGETLAARLVRGPLTLDAWLDVALALSDGLESAHAAGVIHRDLKPANIFLTGRGQPKILDFGLAKTVVRPEMTTRSAGVVTTPGSAAGTIAYMSPEQLRGEDLDGRSDVFSFGLVLYEMATGRRAFDGSTSAVIATAILHDEPPPPGSVRGDLPPDLERIVIKALEKDRELRYQSATEIRSDLKRLRRDLSARRPVGASSPAERSSVKHPEESRAVGPSGSVILAAEAPTSTRASTRVFRLQWGVVAALAIAAAIVIAVVWRRGPAQPSTGTTAFPYLQLQPLTFSGDIQSPAISPDGRFVAFVRQGAIWVRQVSAASADQEVPLAPRVEGRSYESPTITPNGESVDFIVIQGATRELWRVPLLGGTPRPIQSGAGSPIGWSPDGRTMAFVRNDRGISTLVSADAGGGNEHVLVESRAPRFNSFRPAWSPDGREILVIGGSASPTMEEPLVNELLFFDVASGRLMRRVPIIQREVRRARWLDHDRLVIETGAGYLTRLWSTTLRAEGWTPLTREFASLSDFDSTADQNAAVVTRVERRTGIWSSEAGGGTPRLLVAESGAGPGFPVLDDSGGLLYSALLNDGTFGVYRVGPTDSRSVLVASGILSPETWAAPRDGRLVVFTGGERPYPLRRVNVDGSGLATLVPSNGAGPAVTPDARTIVFSPFGPGILSVPLAGGPVRKVSDRSLCCPPVISPDGRRMIVPAVGVIPVICDLPDCARPTELHLGMAPFERAPFRWAPDGRGVAFVPTSDPANIWVQPLDGGVPRRVTEFSDAPIMDFSWSPDGTRLVMSRGTYHSDLMLLKGLLRDASR